MTPEERKKYERLQILIYALQAKDEEWPFEEISKQEAFNEVIKLESILNLGINLDNPDFLKLIQQKINDILSLPPEQPAPNLPPLEILKANLEEKFNNLQEKKIRATYPTLNEQIRALHKRFSEKIRQQLLKKEPQLSQNEFLVKTATENLTLKIARELPPGAKPEILTPQEYQKVIDKMELEINKIIGSLGASRKKITPQDKQELVEKTLPEVQQLSTIPKEFVSFKKLKGIEKSKAFFIDSLTPKQRAEFEKIKLQLQQQAQTSQLKLNPLFVSLYPKAAFALAKKILYSPRIASLKLALEEIKKEYQPLIAQGLLPEDLQITLNTLKEMGLPQDSSILQHLQDEINKFRELEAENPRVFKNIRRYLEYESLTGQKEIDYQPLNMRLPLYKEARWEKGRGYSYYLKMTLDRFRFISNFSQRAIKFLTKGKYKTLSELVKRGITRKAAAWLGKTAFGKAIKSGLKKVGTKLAAKLAIKAGVAAVGAATGPPGWVVAAITLLADKIIALGKKAISLIARIIRDPGKAFSAVLAGALILIIIPMPFALIGIVPLSIGLIGAASFIAAPAAIGAISGGIGAFFTAITTSPVAIAVAPFIIIIMAVLAGLTLFIVITVSGAFILPSTIETAKEESISPYESEFFELTKKIEGQNKFDNPKPEEGPIEVKYIITIKPKGNYILIHPEISDKFSISSERNPPSIGSCNFSDLPEKISPSTAITKECVKSFGSGFENTAIINTVNLNVEVEGKTGRHEGIASARVIIGNPPGECPSGWPTSGKITQGPEGATSHAPHNEEAIDIANSRGTKVYATHEGSATLGKQIPGAGYYVTISGTCDGLNFKTEYFHLENRGRVSGFVKQGDFIGYMSNSGTGGVHLHYEFRPKRPNEPFRMEFDYIPETIVNRTCNSSAQCNKTVVSEYDIPR